MLLLTLLLGCAETECRYLSTNDVPACYDVSAVLECCRTDSRGLATSCFVEHEESGERWDCLTVRTGIVTCTDARAAAEAACGGAPSE